MLLHQELNLPSPSLSHQHIATGQSLTMLAHFLPLFILHRHLWDIHQRRPYSISSSSPTCLKVWSRILFCHINKGTVGRHQSAGAGARGDLSPTPLASREGRKLEVGLDKPPAVDDFMDYTSVTKPP